jgi:hypothetical protein
LAPKIQVREVCASDIGIIASYMRPMDVAECLAWCGLDPWDALRTSVKASVDCRTATIDGAPVALFGVAPAEGFPGVGLPWFLGTPAVDRHGSYMLRLAPRYLLGYLDGFPVLMNAVDARNLTALRWLRHVGATIHPAVPQGVAGLLFHTFELRKRDHVEKHVDPRPSARAGSAGVGDGALSEPAPSQSPG